MKAILVLIGLVAIAFADDKYNSKYDNFDVDSLLNNDRLLKAYLNCFLDKGRCTPEAADFKKALPEAIATVCKKCTEKQSSYIRKVGKHTIAKHGDLWDQIVKKNDPEGKYHDSFYKFINS